MVNKGVLYLTEENTKKDAFDEQIKLYYKYGNDSVFEKPSNEILRLSLILLFISIASFVVYLNI